MLKITVSEDATSETWVLQGWLKGPWVEELRSNWESTRANRSGRECVLDVSDVICMDSQAESLIKGMISEGARLVGCRVHTKHLLSSIGQRHGEKCSG